MYMLKNILFLAIFLIPTTISAATFTTPSGVVVDELGNIVSVPAKVFTLLTTKQPRSVKSQTFANKVENPVVIEPITPLTPSCVHRVLTICVLWE